MATVLTNGGEQLAAEAMAQVGTGGTNAAAFVGWGTGAGTAAKADTTLFTEAAEARVSGTVTVNGTGAAAKYQNVATITSASAQTITNAGNFTASTAGTLMVKGDFAGIALAINDSIQFTITVDPQ